MIGQFLTKTVFNLALEDAFNDPETTITRRLLAGASLDTQLTDGYFSVVQLYEAFRILAADLAAGLDGDDDDSLGGAMVEHLLAGEGDDYQRRLYYIVSERPSSEALADLHWLAKLMKSREAMYKVFVDAGVRLPTLPGRQIEIDKIGCTPFVYD